MLDLHSRLASALATRYLLGREIASGGMGTVYLGHDPTLGRDVAIKLLRPEGATAVAIERFMRESRVLAQLNHPNIVPILEARHDGPLLWFVMPYMSGDTLATAIANGPMPVSQVRQVAADLLDGLSHAHARGVVHRDVKPANIFLQDGRAVLADFGVAALRTGTDDTLTSDGHLVGTLRYMAPEQRDGGAATVASDVYAAGATLFEACTGRRWSDERGGQWWRLVPGSMRHPLRRALAERPADRWKDAASFRRACTRGVHGRRAVAAAGVLAVALATVGVASMMRPPAQVVTAASRRGVALLPVSGDGIAPFLTMVATGSLEWFLPLDALPQLDAATLTETDARAIARFHVMGTATVDSAGRGWTDLVIRDSTGRRRFEFRVPGVVTDSVRWGNDIADSIVAHLMPAQLHEYRQLEGVSRNADALRAFLEGDSLFLRGDGSGARARYRAARAIDPRFARARWAEILTLQWLREPFVAQLDSLARELGPGGPLASIIAVQREPDLARRLAGYATLQQSFPGYRLIRHLHANELFSRGPLTGHPLREGIDSLLTVAQALPPAQRVDVLTHVVWGAIRLGDERLADSASRIRDAIALPDDGYAGFLRLARTGRFARWEGRVYRELAIRFSGDDLARVARLGLHFDNPFDQLVIATRLAAARPDVDHRVSMLAAQASALLAQGQPAAALGRLDAAAMVRPSDPTLRVQRAEWALMLPAVGVDLEEAIQADARRALGAGGDTTPLAHFILAVDATRRNDSAAASVHRSALARRAPVDPIAHELADYATAFQRGHDGDRGAALALTSRIRVASVTDNPAFRGSLTRSAVYLWRGGWFDDIGDREGAARELLWHENNDLRGWPAGAIQEGEVDAALGTIARVRRAELLVRSGRITSACELGRRAAALLRSSEASQGGWVSRAREVVQRCR